MREFKKLPLELFIGYDIEQNSRVIELDASEMVEKYPSGILQLVCKRPGEETTYIAPSFEQDGGTLRWTLTSYDVEKAGQGLAIVALVDTSEESVKVLASHKIRTGIEEGLHFRDAETVDPEDSLIARVLAAVSQAQAYAQDAKEEADRAEAADDAVEDAKDQAIADIEAKGAETLESIPSDYTTLSGDVSDLKSEINEVRVQTRNINIAECGRYSVNKDTGVITQYASSTSIFGISEPIPVDSNSTYTVSFYGVSTNNSKCSVYFAYYDSAKAYISGESFFNQNIVDGKVSKSATTPAAAKYLATSIYDSSLSISDAKIQIEEGTTSTDYIQPFTAKDVIARNEAGKIADSMVGEISFSLNPGYYNADETTGGQSSDKVEKYTNKIYVNQIYKEIDWSLEFSSPVSAWMAYSVWEKDGTYSRTVLVNGSGLEFNGKIIITSNMEYIAFSFRSYNQDALSLIGFANILGTINVAAKSKDIDHNILRSSIGFNPGRFMPCYDHLFVGRTGEYCTIPHESVYHVRLSRRFGFDVIEANIASTQDGVFIVNHLNQGKFGGYFHHVDGETDISNILVSSVTWEWIVENVRYNSSIPKYRTRPCTLQEFLSECRQQNIIPFITTTNTDVIEIADQYMGKDNYIAYAGSRANNPSAIISQWVTRTTKADILAYCESVGKPFIYGMANPTAFTDSQLKEIIDTLHENGYWIATSYADTSWHKYSALGFDMIGAQGRINRIKNGNLYNLDAIYGFDDFTFENATESNAVLTFSAEGTITPNISNDVLDVAGVDIEMVFNGTITIPSFGEHVNSVSYTSDGATPFFATIPVINRSPKVTIQVASGTVINHLAYKVSRM